MFSSATQLAVFIGSSNLTYSGFYCNLETNVLLEGSPNGAERIQIADLRNQLAEWHSDKFSFFPDASWIAAYRRDFARTLKAEKKHRIKTARQSENELAPDSWLRNASWPIYYKEVLKGLKQYDRSRAGALAVLNSSRQKLNIPWKMEYFDELEKRKIIGGQRPYGWFGNVAASGRFRHLLAKGTRNQKQVIVDVVNAIAPLKPPIDWVFFRGLLESLCRLGPTMKVWSRLLCLLRPDLYCTIASISVRKNLSAMLRLPQTRFASVEGYVDLLKVVHASPWFQSHLPAGIDEAEVWQRRAAFMDAIFWNRT